MSQYPRHIRLELEPSNLMNVRLVTALVPFMVRANTTAWSQSELEYNPVPINGVAPPVAACHTGAPVTTIGVLYQRCSLLDTEYGVY